MVFGDVDQPLDPVLTGRCRSAAAPGPGGRRCRRSSASCPTTPARCWMPCTMKRSGRPCRVEAGSWCGDRPGDQADQPGLVATASSARRSTGHSPARASPPRPPARVFGADRRVAVQHAADGLRRDPGTAGHIVDRRHVPLLPRCCRRTASYDIGVMTSVSQTEDSGQASVTSACEAECETTDAPVKMRRPLTPASCSTRPASPAAAFRLQPACLRPSEWLNPGAGGCSSMVEQKLPKLTTRVRFPSPAPVLPIEQIDVDFAPQACSLASPSAGASP